MALKHRERVRAVLNGERPDRAVADMGGRVASLSTPAYLALKAHLGYGDDLTVETVTFLNTIGHFDARVLQHFDVPIRRVFLRPASTFKLEVAEDGCFRDEWGVKRISKKIREKVFEVLQAEVKEYDYYLRGEVYGYEITKDGKDIDSCWGFIGDPEDYMIPQAKKIAEDETKEQEGLIYEQKTAISS